MSEMPQNVDVTLIGSSISSLMTACFLKQENPGFDVVVIGPRPEEEKRPMVGESLIEPSTLWFYKVGLGEYIERQHIVKNALAYHHKLRPEDPSDRRYSLHATDGLIHLSRQLHRPRADEDLRNLGESLGVRFLPGKATSYSCKATTDASIHRHEVVVMNDDQATTLCSRWVIDATGRNRWLGKQVTKYMRPKTHQRSSLWFRLADFEPWLDRMEITQRRPLSYDPWETTHHFMGHGNWIWGIPLQSPEHENLISIGITYRPDLFDHPMKTMDDFLSYMDGEHPVVSEMVRTGRVLDTHVLNNYLYAAEQVYSPNGWLLVGDTAHAVDPLYSTGLTMTVFQIDQINAIIQGQHNGTMRPRDVLTLEALWRSFARQRSKEVSRQYEIMHDPFQACMRRYWDTHTYFEVILPAWWNSMFCDPKAARILKPLFELNNIATAAIKHLFKQVSEEIGPEISQADFDRTTDLQYLVNSEFDLPGTVVPSRFADLFRKRIQYRKDLMRMVPRHRTLVQLPVMAVETLLGKLVPALLKASGVCEGTKPYIEPHLLKADREPAQVHKAMVLDETRDRRLIA